MKKPSRCGNCGSFNVKKKPVYGPFPWKDFRRVTLVRPVRLFQCQGCREHQLSLGDGAILDKAIEATIRMQARKFIEKIRRRERCSQIDLARRLGVTPEYLSAVKSGARIPGFQTFNFLKTLALDKNAFDAADPDLPASTMKRVVGW